MDPSREKHCKTWWLVDWIRRSKQEGLPASRFAEGAQAALDTEESSTPAPSRGMLYRHGVTLAELILAMFLILV